MKAVRIEWTNDDGERVLSGLYKNHVAKKILGNWKDGVIIDDGEEY